MDTKATQRDCKKVAEQNKKANLQRLNEQNKQIQNQITATTNKIIFRETRRERV